MPAAGRGIAAYRQLVVIETRRGERLIVSNLSLVQTLFAYHGQNIRGLLAEAAAPSRRCCAALAQPTFAGFRQERTPC
jgi:hypothetical protein